MKDDACTFLRDDKLCGIHAALGVSKKPTDCRVFPLAFTATPDAVIVGVRMECKQYIASKRNGGALAERHAELTELLAGVDEVNEVPPLVRLDEATTLPYKEYVTLEDALLETARHAPDVVWSGLLALNGAGRELIEQARDAERNLQVFPAPPPGPPNVPAAKVIEAIQLGCSMAAKMNAAANNAGRAARLERVGRAAERLKTTPLALPELSDDDKELLLDHLQQSLFLKEPLNGPHLRFGLAVLNLSVLLAGAGLEESERLNDTLADALKSLRAGPVLGRLNELDAAVAAWFHDELEHWVPH